MQTLWEQTAQIGRRAPLKRDITADVCIIGGGMPGLLTAFELQKRGFETVVLEAGRICGGVTAGTTAKITAQHGLCYAKLIEAVGKEQAAQYASANQRAVERFAELVETESIDCSFERLPAYVYTNEDTKPIEEEARAAKLLGLDASYVSKTGLPFAVKGAVRFGGQAQFHPLQFAGRIAENLLIYEDTRALEIGESTVRTENGSVHAKQVVMTAHFPFINSPGYYFMRMHQERSYVLAVEQPDAGLDGMYIGTGTDNWSLRSWQNAVLIGGAGHRTGENRSGGSYEQLRARAREWYPQARELAHWSAQDCMPLDGVPYIGRYSASTPQLYVATGFQKWGMSSSMVAAEILADQIEGKENAHAKVFSPQRFHVSASMENLIEDASKSISRLLATAFSLPDETLAGIEEGHGGIVDFEGEKVGVYKDKGGEVFVVTTKCPHLGCQLAWNPDDRTWECPCHGSRFNYKGELLVGPAQKGISLYR